MAGVLRFDPDEICVAGGEPLPIACSRMVTPACRDDKKSTIASKTELRQGTRKIISSVGYDPQARHVSVERPSGVMTNYSFDRSDVTASPILPARLFGHFETSVKQDLRQPS
jgi:hypothetical protein